MALCRSALVYLATNFLEARHEAGVEVGTYDTARVWEEVPLSLVAAPGAAPESSSSPASGGFRQGLRQAQGPAIAMAERNSRK